MELKTDAAYQSLLPPLTEEELSALEASCLADGILYPIVATSDGIIVDGHHRWEIATRHGLPYDVKVIEFSGVEEALDWIVNHQCGRRNMNPQQLRLFRGRVYNAVKADKLDSLVPNAANAENEENTEFHSMGHSSPSSEPERNSLPVAEKFGIDERTVRRNAATAAKVATLASSLKTGIEAGVIKATDDDIAKLSQLTLERQTEVARAVRTGQSTLQDAIRPVKDPKAAAKAKCLGYFRHGLRAIDELNQVYRFPNLQKECIDLACVLIKKVEKW